MVANAGADAFGEAIAEGTFDEIAGDVADERFGVRRREKEMREMIHAARAGTARCVSSQASFDGFAADSFRRLSFTTDSLRGIRLAASGSYG